RVARGLWARNTAPELALRAHATIRTAERWLAGRNELSARAIAGLLRSEEGLDFLAALMGEARPRWWRLSLAMLAVGDVRARQAADLKTLRKLRAAIDADRTITDAIARAEAALCLQDAEFYGARFAALRAG